MANDGASPAEGWRARARAFAEEHVVPIAAALDRDDRMPEGLRAALAREGFLGLGLPERWGGSGGDARSVAAVLEEFAHASAAVATLVSVHLAVAAQPVLEWGTDAQRERYLRPLAAGRQLGAFALTEPGVGSDTARLSCGYRRAPDGFRLTGSKMFITNGGLADLVLTFATRDPGAGHRGISAFLVPRAAAGFSVAQRLDKLGLRGSETTELVFQDVALEGDALLGPEGAGLRVALSALQGGRVGIAACALGVARAAFEEVLVQARVAVDDGRRGVVGRAFTRFAAARALVERAAERKDAGLPFVEDASAAKLAASEAAVGLASLAIDLGGRAAARRGARAERLLRDARVFPIVEGTTEIQELVLGRALLGRDADPTAR